MWLRAIADSFGVTCTGPDPDRVVMCNCYLCQKQTGSPFSLQARFPNEQVKVEGKSTTWKLPIDGAKPTELEGG